MEMATHVLTVLKTVLQGVGGLLALYNGIKGIMALNDHNGPGMRDGLIGVASGVAIFLLATYFTDIVFS